MVRPPSPPVRFALALVTAALALGLAACPKEKPGTAPDLRHMAPPASPTPEEATPPEVVPPPLPELPLTPDPGALPPGARALFPAFDGEGFTVTLPARQAGRLGASQVYADVVGPVLRAVGFDDGQRRMRVPDYAGRDQPRADLPTLADLTCREVDRMEGMPNGRKLCAAFRRGQGTPEVDRLIGMGEGMTFAQYRADFERLEIEYFFPQVEAEVPIEHTGILAARWEGETVTLLTGRVFDRYRVVNRVVLTAAEAGRRVAYELGKVPGLCCPERKPPARIELLLLPYGEAGGLPALRYVWRMPVRAYWQQALGLFYVWLDAEDGTLRQLQPLIARDVAATGRAYHRAPDRLPAVDVLGFRVDDAAADQYVLRRTGIFSRPDRFGDGDFDDGEVAIPDDTADSTPTFADFDQPPLDDAPNAVCATGGNTTFEQVDLFATLWRHRQMVLAAGLFTPFPTGEMDLDFKVPDGGVCTAVGSPLSLTFDDCPGYNDAACPDGANHVSVTHDHTYIAHELGHALTPRQYTDRPADWCVGPTAEGVPPMACPVPPSPLGLFHDFADSWSHALENSNCWSGWKSKNSGAADASLNCLANHSEGGSSPRLSHVDDTFDPADPNDHFPEHRALATGGYADMQIAGAALWAVRKGMRSKCLPSGTPQYFVRFVRALRTTGWFGAPAPAGDDLGVYRGLVDLGIKIANQWATSGSPGGPPGFAHNGPHTTNKAVSGFARAGIFLIPWRCLDGDAASADPGFCPAPDGENGGDAVIDVDDQDPGDDIAVEGAAHLPTPEWDFLERGGAAPLFRVWTGPTYTFSGAAATFPDPAPCNTQFEVEVANDDAFTVNLTTSGPIAVDVDPDDGGPDCFGAWPLPPADWAVLDDGDRLFYRVRTRDAMGGNEKLSTTPGNGLFTVPPPYAVINATGTP
jgi:hypothetical protein